MVLSSTGDGEAPQCLWREAVHSELPLQRDDHSFRGLQKRQRAHGYQRQPDQKVEPHGRRVIDLNSERRWNDGVAEDEDHNVRGKVVSAVMVQFFAAH
jgi:hypothetical protein